MNRNNHVDAILHCLVDLLDAPKSREPFGLEWNSLPTGHDYGRSLFCFARRKRPSAVGIVKATQPLEAVAAPICCSMAPRCAFSKCAFSSDLFDTNVAVVSAKVSTPYSAAQCQPCRTMYLGSTDLPHRTSLCGVGPCTPPRPHTKGGVCGGLCGGRRQSRLLASCHSRLRFHRNDPKQHIQTTTYYI